MSWIYEKADQLQSEAAEDEGILKIHKAIFVNSGAECQNWLFHQVIESTASIDAQLRLLSGGIK